MHQEIYDTIEKHTLKRLLNKININITFQNNTWYPKIHKIVINYTKRKNETS